MKLQNFLLGLDKFNFTNEQAVSVYCTKNFSKSSEELRKDFEKYVENNILNNSDNKNLKSKLDLLCEQLNKSNFNVNFINDFFI